ncbi:hypothetical protein Airi01_054060 [Actinoallomurus iriomotensis]|uniref:Uncharacterized protein n=1 Tax=Actinoallomurus iriomotensis TaxID=478107 RepID=A0A9W6VRM4_9ACTN|nr:hypothetical protein Airi01_054060 [Actinoallomurus iriomotensis]
MLRAFRHRLTGRTLEGNLGPEDPIAAGRPVQDVFSALHRLAQIRPSPPRTAPTPPDTRRPRPRARGDQPSGGQASQMLRAGLLAPLTLTACHPAGTVAAVA